MLTPKDAILFKIVHTCAMRPKDAILFNIVHTCAKECLILTYIICPESLLEPGKPNEIIETGSNFFP